MYFIPGNICLHLCHFVDRLRRNVDTECGVRTLHERPRLQPDQYEWRGPFHSAKLVEYKQPCTCGKRLALFGSLKKRLAHLMIRYALTRALFLKWKTTIHPFLMLWSVLCKIRVQNYFIKLMNRLLHTAFNYNVIWNKHSYTYVFCAQVFLVF